MIEFMVLEDKDGRLNISYGMSILLDAVLCLMKEHPKALSFVGLFLIGISS